MLYPRQKMENALGVPGSVRQLPASHLCARHFLIAVVVRIPNRISLDEIDRKSTYCQRGARERDDYFAPHQN